MSRSPPRGDGDEGTEDAEDIEGILQGIMGIRIEDVSNDREGEMYEAQWGIDFGNEGEMYDGQLGIDFEIEGEMYDGQSGIDFPNEVEGLYYEPELYYEHEEWGNELENDEGQWEEEATQGRGTIPFQSDVENVEFPVSNVQLPVSLVAGRSEVTRPKVHTKKYVSCMSVYVVGEELCDDLWLTLWCGKHCRRKWWKQCCCGYRQQHRPAAELCARPGLPYSPVHSLSGGAFSTETIPSFKVYVSGVEDSMALFKGVAIYSSITDEWKGFLGGPDVYRTPAVACNGEVYTTVDSTPPQLVRLSTEAGPRYLWHLELPGFKKCRHWENDKCRHWEEEFSLVGYRGRLLCFCHGIWMLDDARQVWVEIAGRCPLDILLPYLPCNPETEPLTSGSMQVAGDLLVFLPRFYSHRHVAYDMLRRVWRRVPEILALPRADVFQAMPNLRL